MSHVYTSASNNNKGSTITWNGLGLDSGMECIFPMTLQFIIECATLVTVHV